MMMAEDYKNVESILFLDGSYIDAYDFFEGPMISICNLFTGSSDASAVDLSYFLYF
jgi:hypothetical protein